MLVHERAAKVDEETLHFHASALAINASDFGVLLTYRQLREVKRFFPG